MTDCPSHIEARERVAERIEARLEKARADLKHAEENRDGWFSTMPADLWQDMEDEIKLFEDLRTLLATPTQEGVGRGEIAPKVARIIRWVFQHGAEWGGTKHDVTEPAIIYAKAEADILSLLPAPKLGEGAPIPMILLCPECGTQHIDEPDERTPGWTNPPHRSHLCHQCGTIWRPADVATVGVARIETEGRADTWQPGLPPQQPAPGAPEGWRERIESLAISIETMRQVYAAQLDEFDCELGDEDAALVAGVKANIDNILAALTSSSANLGGEEQ